MRIEHVLGAADQVVARDQRAREIDRVERLEQQYSAGNPGEDERAFQPQANSDEDVSDIAEKQKILRAVLPPIKRSPHQQPDRPSELQPERHPRTHGLLLYGTRDDVTAAHVPVTTPSE